MALSGHKVSRTCLGCRQVLAQDELVRYVVDPEGEVIVDYRKKLPGRGCYTCPEPACVEAAVKRNQFERAFKGACRKPAPERLIEMLREAALAKVKGLIGMGRKSSQIVSGSNLVLSALDSPEAIAFVLLALDVSEGVGEKVLYKARRQNVACYRFEDKGTLGDLIGRGERSVVALKAGLLAESIRSELLRYKHIAGES